jgi:hypothetical protein
MPATNAWFSPHTSAVWRTARTWKGQLCSTRLPSASCRGSNPRRSSALRRSPPSSGSRATHPAPVAAEQTFEAARAAGVDLDAITAALETEGVRSFQDSYDQLINCINYKLGTLTTATP